MLKMSRATGENKNMKSDDYNSRYRVRYHYGLLWGSLLIVGGVAGSRFFRISRSTGWSFLLFTTRVTGMYLTFTSIQRLYHSLREPISEEVENSNIPFEHSHVHENFDKSVKENPLHLTKFTDNKNAEDNIVENAADEKTEILNNVVADINVTSEENNIIEDLTDQHDFNEVIVLECESSTNILPKTYEDTTMQDIVAGDVKDAEVVANKAFDENYKEYQIEEAIAKQNSNNLGSYTDVKGCDNEVITAKDTPFNVDAVNTNGEIKSIVDNESYEKEAILGEHGNNSTDNNVNFSLAVDCLNESEYNNEVVTFLQEYKILEPITEKIIATNIDIPEIVASDDLTTDKFDKGIIRNYIIEDCITQEAEIHKFIVKDISLKNLEVEDDLTKIKFDKYSMSILDDEVKEAKLAEKYEIIDSSLTDDVSKSKLSGERKINESDGDGLINEDERKEMISEDIFQCTLTTIEKDIEKNEIEETITKYINIEFSVAKDCITENIDVMVNENIKDSNIEKVASKNICTEHDIDVMIENEIKENEIEEAITKDINIEFPMAKNCLIENIENMTNENIRKIYIEKVNSIDICTEHSTDIDVMIEKEIKENEIEVTIIKDINFEFPVIVDSITENILDNMANENIKEINIEKVASKVIYTEHGMNSYVMMEDKVFKVMDDILIKVSEAQKLIEKDVTIKTPVVESVTDCKLGKDVMATLKKDTVKEAHIDEITATLESLKDHFCNNDENKDIQENIVHQENAIEEQNNEGSTKDIYETSMANDDVDNNILIKEMDENESRKMHMNIESVIPDESVNQGKFGMEIRNNFIEEYNVKDSDIRIVSKDMSIEDRALIDVVEDKLNKEDLKIEVLEQDVKYKTEKDVAKNVTINDVSFDEVCERNLSENIIVNAPLEDSIISQDGVVENVVTKCISIEDNVVKHLVEETFSKDFEEKKLENMVIKSTVGEEDEVFECGIGSPCILVDKTTLTKDAESQNDNEIETTEDQNVNDALQTEFIIGMPHTQQSSKLADRPTAQHINQLLSNSTDELRFLSPNTASDIGVFFRKSNKAKLAAQVLNTSTKPAEDFKDSKSSVSKQSINRSVTNDLDTNQSLNTSSNAVITSVETSSKSVRSTVESSSEHHSRLTGNKICNAKYSPTAEDTVISNTNTQLPEILNSFKDTIAWQTTNTSSNTRDASSKKSSNSCIISPTSNTLNCSDNNGKSATSKYSRLYRNVLLKPKHHQSTGTSRSSVIFLNNQTSAANLPTGQSSSDSESVVVSLSQVTKSDRSVISHSIQSPNILDIAFISSPDQYLRSPNTITISAKDSSPRISDSDAPIPNQSQKSSGNISGTPVDHSPNLFDFPSDKPSKQSPRTSDTNFPPLEDHRLTHSNSQRSSTDDASSHDRHSSKSPDIENRSRLSVVSSSWSDTASQSRHSFRRGNSPRSNPSSAVSEEDVFSRAADSPWTSCENISLAGNPSKSFGRDVFSLARNSLWSSCGNVSSNARHFKSTNDGDVFSQTHRSPWISGSGTIFHAERHRRSSSGRPFSHRRHSRKTLSVSGSGSPKGGHALLTEKSSNFPIKVTSPNGQPTSASLHVESPTGHSVSAESLTVQTSGASVYWSSDRLSSNVSLDTVSSDLIRQQSPNPSVNTSYPMSEYPLLL